jgi:hypothetical protein
MTSGSTREFMALCVIAQHFGRPGTRTDQAWVESFNGHLKIEFPHLLAIEDPATLRAELAVTRQFWNAIRLHAGIGYVTPNDEHKGRGEAHSQSTPGRARSRPQSPACLASPEPAHSTHPGSRRCWLIELGYLSQSQKHLTHARRFSTFAASVRLTRGNKCPQISPFSGSGSLPARTVKALIKLFATYFPAHTTHQAVRTALLMRYPKRALPNSWRK